MEKRYNWFENCAIVVVCNSTKQTTSKTYREMCYIVLCCKFVHIFAVPNTVINM